MSTEMATREPQALAQRYELEVEDMIAQVQKIQQVMKQVMKEGEHYGVIPGTGTKPTLLKPGAEKLCLLFRLAPHYHSVEAHDGKHLTIKSACSLHHIPTGQVWGTGEGSCSTKESKYAFRKGKRACPKCGADAINKSKFPPRGRPNEAPGWYCYAKVGGCGVEFAADDPAITAQETGRVPNEDLADSYNTVLKMANKRSLVAAVLNVTGASDIFTQDLEDAHPNVVETTARRVEPNGDEAERLFPDPAPAPQARRVEMVEPHVVVDTDSPDAHRPFLAQRITALLKARGATKAAAKALFREYLGSESPDLEQCDVVALTALYGHLGEAA